MNQTDLQIIEDFNAQCDDIHQKVEKLIKYLTECLTLEIDSEEKEVEVIKCLELGLDNFDIYFFIDFIEEDQTLALQNIVGECYNRYYQNPIHTQQTQKMQYYLNTCENRLMFLANYQKDNNQNYYKMFLAEQPDTNPQQTESTAMEIEYKPLKLKQNIPPPPQEITKV